MTLLPPLPALAQASAPCGSAPCMQIGREDPDHGNEIADDADHFVYCPEGETVQVEIIARPATIPCNDCEHDTRTVTWTVSGATSHTITDASTSMAFNQTEVSATILLGDAGDTVTITCTVAAASTDEERCEEDRHGNAKHTGNHSEATASCTIKLWRVNLTANVDIRPEYEYPHYACEFAEDVTNTASVVGATPYEFQWTSWIDGSVHRTVTNTSNTWSGKLVDYTSIDCRVKVRNLCDITQWEYAWPGIYIDVTQRRPDWTMTALLDGEELDWLSGQAGAFPQVDETKWAPGGEYAYGQNTNSVEKYRDYATVIVTPIYVEDEDPNPPDLPDDYEAFEGTTEYVDAGPHEGFHFNNDPEFYAVKRLFRSNHWINPDSSVGHPTIPALDMNGNPFTTWASLLQLHEFGPGCKCLYPARHDGEGASAHYNANQRHETYGSPYQSSPPNWALGHQGLMQDAVENGYPAWYDAVWRCDLLYSTTLNGLRTSDEGARLFVNQKLLEKAVLLHQNGYLGVQADSHNFKTDLPVFTSTGG